MYASGVSLVSLVTSVSGLRTFSGMQACSTPRCDIGSIWKKHIPHIRAGCTGRPNVDWCEDNKEDTIRSNVIGTLNLTDCCFLSGIHCTVFATGCIYHYDDAHPIGGPGFKETDPANFNGSFYSETKGHVEEVSRPPDPS